MRFNFYGSMRYFLSRHKLAFITLVYWILLIFIVAAWVWWFISLEKQNKQTYIFKYEQLKKSNPDYSERLALITKERQRKNAQYISEGITFILVTLVGAVFVYRATRRQITLSQQQQNFMMAVTHELKTPISVTQLNLETLQKRKLDEGQQRRLITSALNETERLNVLTNNIIVTAQLESGSYFLNRQPTNLSMLVNKCVHDFSLRLPLRIINADITDDIYIEGENSLLEMMVNNLLDNADKYSFKEKPVKVLLEKVNNKVSLQILDEGPGIADKEKRKIFKKFYRSGSEATRTAKGTGLGLYLSKKIVHDHKGALTVSDNLPQGSIFKALFQTL